MVEAWETMGEMDLGNITLRLLLAVLCGSIVGAERGNRRQVAGIRTFALVCLGSALTMMTNEYLYLKYGDMIDLSRMSAQVVSGIGFLGVGTIIVTQNNQVKGLTTAAGLWAVATLGIAIGAGFLIGAGVGFILIIISIKMLQKLSRRQEAFNQILELYIEISSRNGLSSLISYVNDNDYKLRSVRRKHQQAWQRGDVCAMIEIDIGRKKEHKVIMEEIRKIQDIHYIEEI